MRNRRPRSCMFVVALAALVGSLPACSSAGPDASEATGATTLSGDLREIYPNLEAAYRLVGESSGGNGYTSLILSRARRGAFAAYRTGGERIEGTYELTGQLVNRNEGQSGASEAWAAKGELVLRPSSGGEEKFEYYLGVEYPPGSVVAAPGILKLQKNGETVGRYDNGGEHAFRLSDATNPNVQEDCALQIAPPATPGCTQSWIRGEGIGQHPGLEAIRASTYSFDATDRCVLKVECPAQGDVDGFCGIAGDAAPWMLESQARLNPMNKPQNPFVAECDSVRKFGPGCAEAEPYITSTGSECAGGTKTECLLVKEFADDSSRPGWYDVDVFRQYAGRCLKVADPGEECDGVDHAKGATACSKDTDNNCSGVPLRAGGRPTCRTRDEGSATACGGPANIPCPEDPALPKLTCQKDPKASVPGAGVCGYSG